ncbi:MAG: PEGA domain-containing protein [Planctomycetota bacterium]|nr:MAG: PEGA domain-containing protein [Planctomycetota bacterium]
MRAFIILVSAIAVLVFISAAFCGEGKLHVECDVKADVKIGDKKIGETNTTIDNVPSGKVKITVVAKGFEAVEKEIVIKENTVNRLKVELLEEEEMLKVEFVTNPAGATVWVDGKAHPEKTPCTIEVKPREHEFVITKKGYEKIVLKDDEVEYDGTVKQNLKKRDTKDLTRKGTYRIDFDAAEELPKWLNLNVSGGGSGSFVCGYYVLDMPKDKASAVLSFLPKKKFKWTKPFNIKIRFKYIPPGKPYNLGILRLDQASKYLKSLKSENNRRGSFRWLIHDGGGSGDGRYAISPGATPYAVQPGGKWDGKPQASFNMAVMGSLNVDKTYKERMTLEISSTGKDISFTQYDAAEKPVIRFGPLPLESMRKFARKKYFLSFGDLNTGMTAGKVEIEYIEVKTKK